MTALIFSVCLAMSPHQCEERQIPLGDATPFVCMVNAQAVLADWMRTRPGWRVGRYRCASGERGA